MPRLIGGPRALLFGSLDLAVEFRVLLRFGLWIDLDGGGSLGDEGLEPQRQLPRIQTLRLGPTIRPAQFRDEPRQITVLDEHRFEGREEVLPGLLDLALVEQRPRRHLNLPQRIGHRGRAGPRVLDTLSRRSRHASSGGGVCATPRDGLHSRPH